MSNDARSPAEISKVLDAIVLKKSRESTAALVSLGMLAGIYIGFGAVAATTVGAFGGLPTGLARFLSGSVFSIGLILVIIPGSELFTGNILMVTGLVSGEVPVARVLRNWAFVYLGNFLGSVLLALVIYGSGLMGSVEAPSAVGQAAAKISETKLSLGFGEAFLRGVLCNMLVCLAVILSIASRRVSGKILGIYFPIMTFVLCGYEHSVANMYFLPAGLLAKGTFTHEFLTIFANLIPVTLGNIIGGLVVILLHPARGKQISGALTGHGRKR